MSNRKYSKRVRRSSGQEPPPPPSSQKATPPRAIPSHIGEKELDELIPHVLALCESATGQQVVYLPSEHDSPVSGQDNIVQLIRHPITGVLSLTIYITSFNYVIFVDPTYGQRINQPLTHRFHPAILSQLGRVYGRVFPREVPIVVAEAVEPTTDTGCASLRALGALIAFIRGQDVCQFTYDMRVLLALSQAILREMDVTWETIEALPLGSERPVSTDAYLLAHLDTHTHHLTMRPSDPATVQLLSKSPSPSSSANPTPPNAWEARRGEERGRQPLRQTPTEGEMLDSGWLYDACQYLLELRAPHAFFQGAQRIEDVALLGTGVALESIQLPSGEFPVLQILFEHTHFVLMSYDPATRRIRWLDSTVKGKGEKAVNWVRKKYSSTFRQIAVFFRRVFPHGDIIIDLETDYDCQTEDWSCGFRAFGAFIALLCGKDPADIAWDTCSLCHLLTEAMHRRGSWQEYENAVLGVEGRRSESSTLSLVPMVLSLNSRTHNIIVKLDRSWLENSQKKKKDRATKRVKAPGMEPPAALTVCVRREREATPEGDMASTDATSRSSSVTRSRGRPPKSHKKLTPKERKERVTAYRRAKREHESDVQREERLRDMSAYAERRRLNESADEHVARLETESARSRTRRRAESIDDHAKRMKENRARYRNRRSSMSYDEREAENERRAQLLHAPKHPGFLSNSEGVELLDVGDMEEECEHCGARYLRGESTRIKCCMGGQYKPDDWKERPAEIMEILKAPIVQQNSAAINKCLAFASTNRSEVIVKHGVPARKTRGMPSHSLSSVLPQYPNGKRMFGQIWSGTGQYPEVTFSEELQRYIQNPEDRDKHMAADIRLAVDELARCLFKYNPLAMLYKQAGREVRNVMRESLRKRWLVIHTAYRTLKERADPTVHRGTYNRLRDEDTVLLSEVDKEGRPVEGPKLTVEYIHSGKSKPLPYFSPLLEPLTYPLIHTMAEHGYDSKAKSILPPNFSDKRIGISPTDHSTGPRLPRADQLPQAEPLEEGDEQGDQDLIDEGGETIEGEGGEETAYMHHDVGGEDDRESDVAEEETDVRQGTGAEWTIEEDEFDTAPVNCNEPGEATVRSSRAPRTASLLAYDRDFFGAEEEESPAISTVASSLPARKIRVHHQEKRTSRMSMREYACFLLRTTAKQIEEMYHPVYSQCGLGQLYVEDWSMRILRARHDFLKRKRVEKRRCSAMELSEKVEKLRVSHSREDRADIHQSNAFLRHRATAAKMHVDLGAIMVAHAEVKGSPRYMRAQAEKAMAVMNEVGSPDLFVTFTGSPVWGEIQRQLLPGQKWCDAPDLVNRVFYQKMTSLMDEIIEEGGFGKVAAYAWSLEFQARGMPHVHCLITLEERLDTVEKVDKYVRASIPTEEEDPELRDLVLQFMVHKPCSKRDRNGFHPNKTAFCRVDAKNPDAPLCSKGFPKPFSDFTRMRENGYAEPARPKGEKVETTGRNKYWADNSWVVPYNAYILKKYRSHCNVEACSSVFCCKYMYKYLFKGFDRALCELIDSVVANDGSHEGLPDMTTFDHCLISSSLDLNATQRKHLDEDSQKLLKELELLEEPLPPGLKNVVIFDEYAQWTTRMLITANQAMWSIRDLPISRISHEVRFASVHLPRNAAVVFDKEDDYEEILAEIDSQESLSVIEGWLELNGKDELAHRYTINEAIKHFKYEKKRFGYKWTRRTRKQRLHPPILRLRPVDPSRRENYALRLLFSNVRGADSFRKLATVNGRVCSTFAEAAAELDLLTDDLQLRKALREVASSDVSSRRVARFFVLLLVHGGPSKDLPLEMLEENADAMFLHRAKTDRQRDRQMQILLAALQTMLARHDCSLEQFGLPGADWTLLDKTAQDENDFIDDLVVEQGKTVQQLAKETRDMLNSEQRAIFNRIMNTIREDEEEMDREESVWKPQIVLGSGGCGKTTLLRAIYYAVLDEGKKATCLAYTGCAAHLLPEGRTLHRHFWINTKADGELYSKITGWSGKEKELIETELFVIDEMSMLDCEIIDLLDQLLRKATGIDVFFGGKKVILVGDYRQTLPIIKDLEGDQVLVESLINHPMWDEAEKTVLEKNMRAVDDEDYAALIRQIGDGVDTRDGTVQVCSECFPMFLPSPQDVVDWTFDEMEVEEKRVDSCILALTNDHVEQYNQMVLERMPRIETEGSYSEHIYLSIDSPDSTGGLQLAPEDCHKQCPTGMPPHALHLKREHSLVVQRIDEENEEEFDLSKMLLQHSETGKALFSRFQFPIRLAFAITINKAQGATLGKVGLILTNPVFSHGQLFVAMSRVRDRNSIRIFTSMQSVPADKECRHGHRAPLCQMRNIVYPKAIEVMLGEGEKGVRMGGDEDEDEMEEGGDAGEEEREAQAMELDESEDEEMDSEGEGKTEGETEEESENERELEMEIEREFE